MRRIGSFALLLILAFSTLISAQEGKDEYDVFAAEYGNIETLLSEGGTVTQETLTGIADLRDRLKGTTFRDLYKKTELIDFLAHQLFTLQEVERNRETLETSMREELSEIQELERTVRRRESCYFPALITGGLGLIVSDLSFIFANSAYSRYITAEEPAIGGYYQRMWESFEAAGYMGSLFSCLSLLVASGSLANSETAVLTGVPDLTFIPSDDLAIMTPEDRYTAVEKELDRVRKDIDRAVIGVNRNKTADTILLTSSVLAFLTSGVSSYLAEETQRRLQSDPANSSMLGDLRTYNSLSGYSAGAGAACLSGSLLLRLFGPRPSIHRRELAELEAYKKSLEQ